MSRYWLGNIALAFVIFVVAVTMVTLVVIGLGQGT